MGKESETEIRKEIRTEIGGNHIFYVLPNSFAPSQNDNYDYSYYYCTVLCSTLHSHFVFSVPPLFAALSLCWMLQPAMRTI